VVLLIFVGVDIVVVIACCRAYVAITVVVATVVVISFVYVAGAVAGVVGCIYVW